MAASDSSDRGSGGDLLSQARFIWGPGGVGKSHVAIREVFRQTASQRLLLTLDPSRRLFHLLEKEPGSQLQNCELGSQHFDLKATDAIELFEKLNEKAPASESVQSFFQQLVRGLQRFQDYLCLIELAEEIQASHYPMVTIDTPPFSEAVGIHHAMLNLSEFFKKSIVQISKRDGLMSVAVKKLLDVARIFAGKKVISQSLEFIDWLSLHLDRFQTAADQLENIVTRKESSHLFVLTPESSFRVLESALDFFQKTSKPEFLINKSAKDLDLKSAPEALHREFSLKQKREADLVAHIRKLYPSSPIQRLPVQVMGQDSKEELLQFCQLQTTD